MLRLVGPRMGSRSVLGLLKSFSAPLGRVPGIMCPRPAQAPTPIPWWGAYPKPGSVEGIFCPSDGLPSGLAVYLCGIGHWGSEETEDQFLTWSCPVRLGDKVGAHRVAGE